MKPRWEDWFYSGWMASMALVATVSLNAIAISGIHDLGGWMWAWLVFTVPFSAGLWFLAWMMRPNAP